MHSPIFDQGNHPPQPADITSSPNLSLYRYLTVETGIIGSRAKESRILHSKLGGGGQTERKKTGFQPSAETNRKGSTILREESMETMVVRAALQHSPVRYTSSTPNQT